MEDKILLPVSDEPVSIKDDIFFGALFSITVSCFKSANDTGGCVLTKQKVWHETDNKVHDHAIWWSRRSIIMLFHDYTVPWSCCFMITLFHDHAVSWSRYSMTMPFLVEADCSAGWLGHSQEYTQIRDTGWKILSRVFTDKGYRLKDTVKNIHR